MNRTCRYCPTPINRKNPDGLCDFHREHGPVREFSQRGDFREDELLGVEQISVYLHVSEREVRNMFQKGEFGVNEKIGGQWRISLSQLDQYLKKKGVRPETSKTERKPKDPAIAEQDPLIIEAGKHHNDILLDCAMSLKQELWDLNNPREQLVWSFQPEDYIDADNLKLKECYFRTEFNYGITYDCLLEHLYGLPFWQEYEKTKEMLLTGLQRQMDREWPIVRQALTDLWDSPKTDQEWVRRRKAAQDIFDQPPREIKQKLHILREQHAYEDWECLYGWGPVRSLIEAIDALELRGLVPGKCKHCPTNR